MLSVDRRVDRRSYLEALGEPRQCWPIVERMTSTVLINLPKGQVFSGTIAVKHVCPENCVITFKRVAAIMLVASARNSDDVKCMAEAPGVTIKLSGVCLLSIYTFESGY